MKTILISGGSRGIGLAIGRRLARDKCNLILAAKTIKPHPKLAGTLHEAVKEINQNPKTHSETTCEAMQLDLRNEQSITNLIQQITKKYKSIDLLINNASAIDNRGTLELPIKKYDLIHSINSRGTFLMTQACLPHLLTSTQNPKVLTLSPPISLDPMWFKMGGTGYTLSKYQMSMMSIGLGEEFCGKVAFNSLWPKTAIWTEATKMLMGETGEQYCRSPEIMAEAAYHLLQEPISYSGNTFLDEEILDKRKIDSKQYNLSNKTPLPDLFVGNPNTFFRQMMKYQTINFCSNLFKGINTFLKSPSK